MVVEIEKSAVTFTDESRAALQRTLMRLERRIRAKAADNAIKSQGTPAEVTGSDIEKAYRELIDSGPRNIFDERAQRERSIWRKSSRLHLISMSYIWLGLVVAIVGGVYPYVHAQLSNPIARTSVLFVASGLLMAVLGLGMRWYMRYLDASRTEDYIRRITANISAHKEID